MISMAMFHSYVTFAALFRHIFPRTPTDVGLAGAGDATGDAAAAAAAAAGASTACPWGF